MKVSQNLNIASGSLAFDYESFHHHAGAGDWWLAESSNAEKIYQHLCQLDGDTQLDGVP